MKAWPGQGRCHHGPQGQTPKVKQKLGTVSDDKSTNIKVDNTNLSDERKETLGLIKKDKLVCIEESASGGHHQSELAHKVGKLRNHNQITNSNKLFLIEEIREHS